jgi:hypothetical protein
MSDQSAESGKLLPLKPAMKIPTFCGRFIPYDVQNLSPEYIFISFDRNLVFAEFSFSAGR